MGDHVDYAKVAWGKLCQAELPWKGLAAAHGQITERKYSIAQLGIIICINIAGCLLND
jgi:hypothetical protein